MIQKQLSRDAISTMQNSIYDGPRNSIPVLNTVEQLLIVSVY